MRHQQTILQAAIEIGEPFTVEELTVKAWLLDKRAFGLRSFEDQHPNSRRVAESIYGQRGLINQGLLAKGPDGLLQITNVGRIRIQNPSADGSVHYLLSAAMLSEAFLLFSRGEAGGISFRHACDFWSVPRKFNRAQLTVRLREFEELLRDRDVLAARSLAPCHDHLRGRFDRHIHLLAS